MEDQAIRTGVSCQQMKEGIHQGDRGPVVVEEEAPAATKQVVLADRFDVLGVVGVHGTHGDH